MKNFKMVGLLAVVAMALVAFVGPSSASAAAKFTASAGGGKTLNTSLVTNQVFKLEGSEVECEEIAFAGTTAGAESPTQTVAPSYKECVAFGFAGATVNTSTCKYTFGAATPGSSMANVELSGCFKAALGIEVAVHVPFIAHCTVDIPQQTISTGTEFGNTASSIIFAFTWSGFTFNVTESRILCPLTEGTQTNGEYKGASMFTASSGTFQWDAS